MWYQGRKTGENSREDKISKENEKGKNSKLVPVGFKAGVKYTEAVAYGFFKQTVVQWQAGDVTYWKAEVLQSSLPK